MWKIGIRGACTIGALLIVQGCADMVAAPDWLSGRAWESARGAETLDQKNPHFDYYDALQSGYRAAAEAERAEYDWDDARAFLDKAERAGQGRATPPFTLTDRPVDGSEGEALKAARVELARYVSLNGALLRAGRQLGEAQVLYDRWHQEAEEGHQTAEIAKHRGDFEEMMILVRAVAELPADMAVVLPEDGKVGGIEVGGVLLNEPYAAASISGRKVPVDEGEIKEAFKDALAARPPKSQYYCVLFELGRNKVIDANFSSVWLATWEVNRRPGAEILILGQADGLGAAAANLRLSERRARSVRAEAIRQLEGARNIVRKAKWIGEGALGIALNADHDPNCAEDTSRRVILEVR